MVMAMAMAIVMVIDIATVIANKRKMKEGNVNAQVVESPITICGDIIINFMIYKSYLTLVVMCLVDNIYF